MSDKVSDYIEEKTGVDLGVSDRDIAVGGTVGSLTGVAVIGGILARDAYNDYRARQERIFNHANIDGARSIDDPREKMSRQLLMRGHASMDEVLEASFGEWPPNGLDIVTRNPQTVAFGDIADRIAEGLSPAAGDATTVGERRIRMNHEILYERPSVIGRSAYTPTLGHEGVHILQGDNYYRAADLYGTHTRNMEIKYNQQMILGDNDVVASVFRDHSTEEYIKNPDPYIKTYGIDTGIEVQARVHEVMIGGYQEWGQLPTTREEFLVSMKNSGLDVPDEVMDQIRNSPTFEETNRVFGQHDVIQKGPIQNINVIQNGLTPEGRIALWDNAMPSLYADLIEMYGDGPGRARFDMGVNRRPELRINWDPAATAKTATQDVNARAADGAADIASAAPDNTRATASLTNNFADAATGGVQEASKFARMARLGANAPVVGTAVGAGGAFLTNRAHAGQREYAEELRDQGVLDEEAYERYVELNSETETMLHADIGLSAVDPTGLSVVATAGVEMQARGAFKDWADEHAPHLSEEQFQSLSMSMFPDSSARNEMVMEALDHLPDSKVGQPEFMHDIIDGRSAYQEARAELSGTPVGPGPRHGELSETVDRMEQDLVKGMEELMSHPQGVDAVLDAVPVEDRMEYARRLAASEGDIEQFAENHPQIADYVQAHEESFTGLFLKEDDVLQQNPDLLNDYIKERSGISGESTQLADSQSTFELGDFSGPDATYAGDPGLAAELAEAGVSVNPELLPPEQIAAAANTANPQIPQL